MVNDAGVLRRFHYPPERPASGRSLAELSTCSRLAIRKFNDAKVCLSGPYETLTLHLTFNCNNVFFLSSENKVSACKRGQGKLGGSLSLQVLYHF